MSCRNNQGFFSVLFSRNKQGDDFVAVISVLNYQSSFKSQDMRRPNFHSSPTMYVFFFKLIGQSFDVHVALSNWTSFSFSVDQRLTEVIAMFVEYKFQVYRRFYPCNESYMIYVPYNKRVLWVLTLLTPLIRGKA